ncbi:MAG TPA: thioredoxin domain-containing protein [Thermoplasmata archaeon]|nr:thioredoxin domain-containing protein [Thermoplasmata archaeon]
MPSEPTGARTRADRLLDARSAYLRSAAEQSIDWHPWGTEPFELARRRNRPVLLDIGASWCHWCHVMDEGTYTDSEVARLIAQHFVAVKVDRDENPEVDRRYQLAVNALTGEGGWPLTAFLTPEGEAFLGGTYFPAKDGMGRPGLRRVLDEVARLWKEDPEQVRTTTGQLRAALGRLRPATAPTGAVEVGPFLDAVRADLTARADPANGGYGDAPKFPHPVALRFELVDAARTGSAAALERARLTLEKMAEGGMHDQVAGGFHRYSVDAAWHIPHFEKMAVDNAALLEAYADGAARFGDARFERVLRTTVGWVAATLGDPAGGFAASQDADNAPGDDGSYFTWSRPELKQALDATEFRLVARRFGVGTEGRMPHDPERNVLFELLPLEEAGEGLDLDANALASTWSSALAKLASVRSRRPAPGVDRALYTNLNGGFLVGLSRAGSFLSDDTALALARRAADRFLDRAYDPDRGMAHRLEGEEAYGRGLLDDQVEFVRGLLELAAATGEGRYLERARELLALVERRFRRPDGLLADLSPELYDGPKVGGSDTGPVLLEDSPHLSPNAGAALAQIRMAGLTGDPGLLESLAPRLSALRAAVRRSGLFAAGTALASALAEEPPARVVVEGTGAEARALLVAARRSWHPNVVVFRGAPPPPFSLPDELGAGSGGSTEARALICFGTRCLAPVREPTALAAALRPNARA